MAEDAVNAAIKAGKLEPKNCLTKSLPIHGSTSTAATNHLSVYGSDAIEIIKSWEEHPGKKKQLHPAFPYTEAEVLWAVQHEMARTVEDVLARRLRLLFLDAEAAVQAAPCVAHLLKEALCRSTHWEEEQVRQFTLLASQYMITATDVAHFNELMLTN
jgi:glycerol-3-phosphate dehydrogenase